MSSISHDPDGTGELVRRVIPAMTVLVALLLMALPLPLAWGVMPNLALMLVAVWASIQPRLMAAWVGFLLGLMADLLFGLPVGIWALLFPLTIVLVRIAEARVEGHSLAIDWAFAALLALGIHLLAWQIGTFLGGSAPALPYLVQAGASILAYPVVAMAAARIQRRLTVFGD